MSHHRHRAPKPASHPVESGRTISRQLLVLGLATVVMIGVGLRVAAAQGDLWLDELWSIMLTNIAQSPLGVFTRLHSDNNHHLNTLWLMLVGPDASPFLCRLLAVWAAAGTLVLVATGQYKNGRYAAVFATVLVALSDILVNYGSEARGYGLAIFFALAAYRSIERFLETGRTRWAAVYAGASLLGILSHVTFVFPLAGCLAWIVFEMVRRRGTFRAQPFTILLLFVPVVSVVLLWWFDLRYVIIGGGPPYSILVVLRELGRSMVGAPEGPGELLAVAAFAAALVELFIMALARDGRAVFYAVALVVVPAFILIVERPVFFAPRYFVVVVPFFLMLVGSSLDRLDRQGRWGRPFALGILLFFAIADSSAISRQLKLGRGRYREAVTFMRESSTGPVVTVGSDHDFRNRLVIDDQVKRRGLAGAIVYVPREQWSPEGPEWFLRHDFSTKPKLDAYVRVDGGRPYALVAVYPYAGLSGFSWLLYHAVAPALPYAK